MEEKKDKNSLYKKIRKKINFKDIIVAIIRLIIIVGISYIILLPLLTKISTAFMEEIDIYDPTVRWIPRHFTLENFAIVWEHMEYPKSFLNSFIFAFLVSLFQLISCTLIGYGFARFDFKGKSIWFGIVIFMLIVPPQVISTSLYLNFRYLDFFGLLPDGGLNLINTFWPLLLLAITGTGYKNGLFIYIARQFFKGMPRELEESAYVDGAGPLRTFYSIMLPGAVPVIIIIFLFSFVWQWNDSYFVELYMGDMTLLPRSLQNVARNYYSELVGEVGDDIAMISFPELSIIENTGMLMFMAPLLLLYVFLQRYFIESVARTGIVG